VAAIFPEQFQSVTDALKIIFFINYFAEIQLSCLPKCKKRHIQANMNQKEVTRAMLVSGLRTKHTWKKIMSSEDIKKH
jgi:hypothetical protein